MESPLQKIKNELDKKIARLQFWKYNKTEIIIIRFPQMNPVFI